MDDPSIIDLRGVATAANLRRAFAAPVEAELPSEMASLLRRLGDMARHPCGPDRHAPAGPRSAAI